MGAPASVMQVAQVVERRHRERVVVVHREEQSCTSAPVKALTLPTAARARPEVGHARHGETRPRVGQHDVDDSTDGRAEAERRRDGVGHDRLLEQRRQRLGQIDVAERDRQLQLARALRRDMQRTRLAPLATS